MAKINLLTIHWGRSYGAVMQTYATSKLLERNGHDVTVINVIHPRFRHFYKKIRSFLYFFMDCQFSCFKHRYFSKLTRKMYGLSLGKIPQADYVVIGSDQVWNRDITAPMEFSYFVDFNDDVKKISLSSSFGKSEWSESDDYTQKVKNYLSKFDAISVREDTGKGILKDVFLLDSTVLIDPTLAYADFNDLVLDNREKKQIYTFLFSNEQETKNIVKAISADLELPVFKHSKLSFYLKNGPRRWLTNIRNSSCVITDSFHGLAFSIIFKKQFFVLCADEKKFTRLRSLLMLLGLQERFIQSEKDYHQRKDTLYKVIDYVSVDDILHMEQNKYNRFIQQHIK